MSIAKRVEIVGFGECDMVRRVGLLTLPLHTNYGGIVQIAALYQFLARNGKVPLLLRKKPVRSWLQRVIAKTLWTIPFQNIGGARGLELSRAIHYPFINRFMPNATRPLRTSKNLRDAVQQHELGAVIVGSDQVWRFDYHSDTSPMAYFLDFVDSNSVRPISYAASFGHGAWKFPEYTQAARDLLSKFYAVSVREESGRDVCRDDLGRADARLVIDPTLLVDPSFYDEAVASGQAFTRPTILRYVLDQSDKVQRITTAVTERLGADGIAIYSIPSEQREMISIPKWLQAFRDAEYVVTDSFHGTIFAIVFKKNFVTIPNHDRGLDRFTSLLDLLGLRDRLLISDDLNEVSRVLSLPIDYEDVFKRIAELRADSSAFLLSALA